MDAFDKHVLGDRLAVLAGSGIYLGTSSWKYPGWLGTVYDETRYHYRGTFAQKRFDQGCLVEYAETFKTVCVDATYYSFPNADSLQAMASQTPPDFRFGFKVTDAITIKRYPNLPRFGARAGQPNADFLNSETFVRRFLEPCSGIRAKVGVIIFELSRFQRTEFQDVENFLAVLEPFLAALPTAWPFAIELRNREWLTPAYFACLSRHGIGHVFNSWTNMPKVSAQMALPGSRTNPNLVAGRFLVTPGTFYETSVAAFEPFDRLRAIDDDARAAVAGLLAENRSWPSRRTYLFINNRLEGSAPRTIDAIVAAATS